MLAESVLGQQSGNLGHELGRKHSPGERPDFEHPAGSIRLALGQRDAALFSRSVGGQNEHGIPAEGRGVFRRLGTLHQFEQHAARACGMHEHVAMAAGSDLNLF